MRFGGTLIVSIFLGAFALSASAQTPAPVFDQPREARFGFVIGNDDYKRGPLPTAANDAALVADALKAAGFDVTGARNLDAETFRAAYREFLEKIQAAGSGAVAAIYISGYGLQNDGENFLVPRDASIAQDADLALSGVRLSDLMRPLDGLQNRAKIVLFDLAYASPFIKENPPAPGLALSDPDRGSLVGYNAGPGEVAPTPKRPYGAYAQAFAEMVRQPGLDMNEIMLRVRARVAELSGGAQVPWHVSKIEPPLVLLERGADAPASKVAPEAVAARRQRPLRDLSPDEAYATTLERDTPRAYEEYLAIFPSSSYVGHVRGLLAARREAAIWRRSLMVNSPAAYWSYVRRYPLGPHLSEARARLARLSVAAEPPPGFAEIPYDLGPPSPEELAYLDARRTLSFNAGAPPSAAFLEPPPHWWRLPPAPVFADDAGYYLAETETILAPAWVRPPASVAAPPAPIIYEDRAYGAAMPYVAIPAALAAGIVAGRIIDRKGGNVGRSGRLFLPPVTALAAAIRYGALQTIRLQPGTGAPIHPGQVHGNIQELLPRSMSDASRSATPAPVGRPAGPASSPASPVPLSARSASFAPATEQMQRRQLRAQQQHYRRLQAQQEREFHKQNLRQMEARGEMQRIAREQNALLYKQKRLQSRSADEAHEMQREQEKLRDTQKRQLYEQQQQQIQNQREQEKLHEQRQSAQREQDNARREQLQRQLQQDQQRLQEQRQAQQRQQMDQQKRVAEEQEKMHKQMEQQQREQREQQKKLLDEQEKLQERMRRR